MFSGKHVSLASVAPADRAIIVSGFSKSYAMTGWRLGYLVLPAALAGVAASFQEPIMSCPSAPSQTAAIAALSGPQVMVADARETFRRRRDILVDVFANRRLLPVTPQGAFYGLIDISWSEMGSLEFAKEFLINKNVAVVPGITFGPSCDRYVRVAFTTSDEELREGLLRLRDFLQSRTK